MALPEDVEKVRQGIMRLRELLDLMRGKLEEGERLYSQLFDNCSPQDVATLKEKDLQWQAALTLADDPSPLSKAALIMRFEAREMERSFEDLFDTFTPG